MDVSSRAGWFTYSNMTPWWCYLVGSVLLPVFQNFAPICHLHRCNSVRVHSYPPPQHMKVLNDSYASNMDVGGRIGWFTSSRHDTMMLFGLQHTPQFSKFGPHLHRCNSVRVHPYAHSQHTNVLKHFEYIQYGCNYQSRVVLILQTWHHDDVTWHFGPNLAPQV